MRTYYCVEMHVASYPVNEIHCQTRPFADSETSRRSHKVRATSKAEAIEKVRAMLSAEREEALDKLAGK